MDLGLKAKKAIVTGGSKGIGAATVAALLKEAVSVSFCGRDSASIKTALGSFEGLGGAVQGSVSDISDHQGHSEWIAEQVQSLGGLDIFVANASAGAEQGAAGWRANFEADLLGTVAGAEAVLPALAQSGGSIVIIGSISATDTAGAPSPYGALKAALIHYSNQLGAAAAPHGVRVNTISPGPIHVDGGFWGKIQQSNPHMYQQIASRHMHGRLGSVEEVANSVVFLCSDAASWITRTNLVVDGGFSSRIQY